MLITNERSRPLTPVRARSPHSMMIARIEFAAHVIGDLDRGHAGKGLQRRRRQIAVDQVDVFAERAQRVGHGQLRSDRVAVRP